MAESAIATESAPATDRAGSGRLRLLDREAGTADPSADKVRGLGAADEDGTAQKATARRQLPLVPDPIETSATLWAANLLERLTQDGVSQKLRTDYARFRTSFPNAKPNERLEAALGADDKGTEAPADDSE